MSRKADPNATGRTCLSLDPEVTTRLRALADEKGVSLAEVVRRALNLYSFAQSLAADEQLQVVNRNTGERSHLVMIGG